MGILNELREESNKKRDQLLESQSSQQELLEHYESKLLPKMQFIYTYFKELTEHLEFIKEPTRVSSYSRKYEGLDKLSQQDYKLSTDKHGGIAKFNELKALTLRYYCLGEHPIKLDVLSQSEIDHHIKFLTSKKVPFQWIRQNNEASNSVAQFAIEAKIPVVVKFEVDIPSSKIKLQIQNHLDFDLVQRKYSSDEIDEAFLDKLAKFLLRKDNSFIQIDISEEHKEEIRNKLKKSARANLAVNEEKIIEEDSSLIGKIKSFWKK